LRHDPPSEIEEIRRYGQYPAEPVLRHQLQAAGVPLAAGVLYPVLGILLSPVVVAGKPWFCHK
jgi:hypothetical protein